MLSPTTAIATSSESSSREKEMRVIATAAWMLTLSGLALVGMGGYFVFARPALLPEDTRFMDTTLEELLKAAPGLSRWLKRVFWVMGGFIASTGVLVTYLANTGLRAGEGDTLAVLTLVWATSIGWMALVNVLIGSDFRIPLLALAGLWGLGLVLAAVGR
jgi:hypothetical protein